MTSTSKLQVPIEQLPKNFDEIYTHDLQLYQNVPVGEIMLEELQEICETRLKVLILVERVHLLKITMPVSKRKAYLVEQLHKDGLNEYASFINSPGYKSHKDADVHMRRKDHISHFILRATFAFDVLKKHWFFKQEARLFKWRFSSLDSEGIWWFMRINNFDFTPISQSEKESIREYLQMSSPYVSDIDSMQFYKIPFFHATNLIKKRKVFIKQGEVYVPEKEMGFVLSSHFRENLISRFEDAREARANLYNDERLVHIFTNLEKSIHIKKAALTRDKEIQKYVSLNKLDNLAETCYPLCMRVLHKGLRKNHHLTHGGRVQYGLFLKGIGISLPDALTFWKNEFTKIMDEYTFNKEHVYQIKFAFGSEGSRRDYQPYKCLKIMNATIGARDYHGCPFKHMVPDILEIELADCGFNALERSAIITLAKNGQYSAACNKYYEIKYDCVNDVLFKHPNIYFNKSVKHCILYRNHDLDLDIEDIC